MDTRAMHCKQCNRYGAVRHVCGSCHQYPGSNHVDATPIILCGCPPRIILCGCPPPIIMCWCVPLVLSCAVVPLLSSFVCSPKTAKKSNKTSVTTPKSAVKIEPPAPEAVEGGASGRGKKRVAPVPRQGKGKGKGKEGKGRGGKGRPPIRAKT